MAYASFDLTVNQIQLFLTDTCPPLLLARISISRWCGVTIKGSGFAYSPDSITWLCDNGASDSTAQSLDFRIRNVSVILFCPSFFVQIK